MEKMSDLLRVICLSHWLMKSIDLGMVDWVYTVSRECVRQLDSSIYLIQLITIYSTRPVREPWIREVWEAAWREAKDTSCACANSSTEIVRGDWKPEETMWKYRAGFLFNLVKYKFLFRNVPSVGGKV